ncbi:hypothetical protein [Kytococcus schroeteri]|nr:hypothetical protein [Kytococcus schroeteri]
MPDAPTMARMVASVDGLIAARPAVHRIEAAGHVPSTVARCREVLGW